MDLCSSTRVTGWPPSAARRSWWPARTRADRAWQVLAGRGFRREFQGVTMHRPNEAGYSTSDSYVIDDWR